MRVLGVWAWEGQEGTHIKQGTQSRGTLPGTQQGTGRVLREGVQGASEGRRAAVMKDGGGA